MAPSAVRRRLRLMQQSWREVAAARRALLEAELPALVRSLAALGAKMVVLFGSLARGDVRSTSDIDLLVVLDLPGRFADRLAAVYGAIDPGVGVRASAAAVARPAPPAV